jgi:hypothetical protein
MIKYLAFTNGKHLIQNLLLFTNFALPVAECLGNIKISLKTSEFKNRNTVQQVEWGT